MVFVKVAKKVDISIGKMEHLEVEGKEILIANVGGKFYAINDRCGHMNARLSMGTLVNTVVTCPQHSARFDVTTGKLISGPKPMEGGVANVFAKCPEEVQKNDDADGSTYGRNPERNQNLRQIGLRSEN
jgi:nitrite reductase/ring-hydroxylating ferredoxin subunit